LKTAVEVFQDVISYESRNGKEFKSEIRIRKYMRDLAKTIVLRKQIISTSIDSEYFYTNILIPIWVLHELIYYQKRALVINISTKEFANI
jgi:hypothetical protein